jgi:tRNA threonylcarbamoyladenosine biosynthesis protein TsaE
MHFAKLLPDEAATIELGLRLAQLTASVDRYSTPLMVHLRGDLGAGKSTLCRAWLRAMGVTGAIKSPTYALIEAYELATGTLLHLDLYRLSEAAELDYLGLDAYLERARLVLIEWPERALNRLMAADLELQLSHALVDQREIRIEASTERGRAMIGALLDN